VQFVRVKKGGKSGGDAAVNPRQNSHALRTGRGYPVGKHQSVRRKLAALKPEIRGMRRRPPG